MTESGSLMPESAFALPPGTRMHEFVLKRVLGVGGFGIVYLAWDELLQREVAIKEYLPATISGRSDTLHVTLRTQSDQELFSLGLRSFVNEARLLARFNHRSLIKVYRFWEGHGTAYMTMPVLRGANLRDLRRQQTAFSEPWLRNLLDEVLGVLQLLHSAGVYHRDISPDNIVIEPDGLPILLDFGAARHVIGDKSQVLTAILKPAYAPIEQYGESGSLKQGPWTDFYALGATLHFLLVGQPPEPSTARVMCADGNLLCDGGVSGVSAEFLQVVDWMLAPKPEDRPVSVQALRKVLDGEAACPHSAHRKGAEDPDATIVIPRPAVGEPPAMAAQVVRPASQASTSPNLVEAPPTRTRRGPMPVVVLLLSAVAVAAFVGWPSSRSPAEVAGPTSAGASAASASQVSPVQTAQNPVPPDKSSVAAAPVLPTAPAATSGGGDSTPSASSSASVPATAPVRNTSRQVTQAGPVAGRSATSLSPSAGASGLPPATTTAPAQDGKPLTPAARELPTAPPKQAPLSQEPPSATAASAPTQPEGPLARCASKGWVQKLACMEDLCWRGKFRAHADCIAWRSQSRPAAEP